MPSAGTWNRIRFEGLRTAVFEMNLSLRPITKSDESFLYALYASTREEELSTVQWSEQEKESFLRMQFTAQHTYYRQQYPAASFQILLSEEQAVGRLYVHRRPEEIRLIDIALLPEFRNRGIGSSLMKQLFSEGAAAGLPVRFHVERNNPAAVRFYERLGCRTVHHTDLHFFMEWSPPRPGPA